MRDLLEMYTAASHRLKVQFFDPAKSPGLAKRYNIEEYNTAVFSSKDKEAKIKGQTEEEITNALIQVSRDAKKTVYFLQGHGEASIDETRENGYSHIKEELEKENFIVKKLVLLNEPGIPHDCSVLVIAGPKVAITPQELKVINEYLVMAGRALFLADPRETTGLENFLLPWGVKLGNDVIIDRVARALVGSELMPVATQYEEHPLTRNFRYATAYPMARSVDVTDKNDHGAADTVIGRTSPQSWAETDLSTLFEKNAADFNADKDRQGPIPLIVAATAPGKMPPEETPGETGKKLEEKVPETRIVVIGCSQFPNNQYCSFPGNSNFLMNTIAWLAEEEDLISIRPSTQSPKTISLTREQASLVFYSSLFGLPGAVLIIGIVVWVRRRNR